MTPADAIRQPALKLRPSRFPGRFFCLAEGTPGILRFGAGAPPRRSLNLGADEAVCRTGCPFRSSMERFFAM